MILVTFSGLDGCGKSTQVALTRQFLADRGLDARILVAEAGSIATFQARISDWLRARFGKQTRADKRIPDVQDESRPGPKRYYRGGRTFEQDRNRRLVNLRRLLVYPVDCLLLRARVAWHRLTGCQALVCDRYIFDKIQGLPTPGTKFARWLCAASVRPTVAIFLDVTPKQAAARDYEHHPDYYATKYAGYWRTVELGYGLIPVASDDKADTQRRIQTLLTPHLLATPKAQPAGA